MFEHLTLLDIGTQTLGFMGMGLGVYGLAQLNDTRMRLIGATACLVWAAHFALLGAWAGCIINLFCALRDVISLRQRSLWVVGIFTLAPLALTPWIVTSVYDIPILLATITDTWAMFTLAGLALRSMFYFDHIAWLIHNIAHGSVGGIIIELIYLTTTTVTVARLYFKKT